MTISLRFLLKSTVWTVGAYGLGQALRLATNIILARLLAPQLFGIMVIVNSLRMGVEYISDVGISQNIVYHKDANDPEFYNTAWTVQAIRSVGVWLIAVILAAPVAQFYQTPILILLVPVVSFASVFAGFSSVSVSLLQKRLQVGKLNAFDLLISLVGSAALLLFAYISRTIWALVFGFLFGGAVSMIGTYFLLPGVKQRFYLSKRYLWEILHFGKWVFAASLIFFLSSNFDRLYLGKVISLGALGVYGIARSMADVLGMTVARFGNHVLFPLVASYAQESRSNLREQLVGMRAKFLYVTGFGFSLAVVMADLPIKILYDSRYQAAAWMLPLFVAGSWFSILSAVNESTLLGLGKPLYGAVANTSKFLFLLIGLPLSVMSFGLPGAIVVMAISDLFRYFPILIGQRREHFSFTKQDLTATVATFLLIGLWEWLRWAFGFGNSFETLPVEISAFIGHGH
jgi:O-antigen/teichoic acid export membrane protein